MKGLGEIELTDFYGFMEGYCMNFEDFSDGAWQAACMEGVVAFNKEYATHVDPYEGWLTWAQDRAA